MWANWRAVTLTIITAVCGSMSIYGSLGCGAATEIADALGDLSVTASVTIPSTSNVAVPLTKGKGGWKAVTETAADAKTVTATDLAGKSIGTGCTTTTEGTCKVTGLTKAQLKTGVIIIVNTGTTTMRTLLKYTEAEIDAASAGLVGTASVNTETDLAYSVQANACENDLANCPKVDTECIREVVGAMVGDDSPSTADFGGYTEALYEAHAKAISGATAGGTAPSELARLAFGGKHSDYTAQTGTTVTTGSVPVKDAVTSSKTVFDTIKTALCAKTDADTKSKWEESEDAAATASQTFRPRAIVGIFESFTTTEITNYETEDFQALAASLPALPGGMDMFGTADATKARVALRNAFRNGNFADPTKKDMALGVLAATLPKPTTAGDFTTINYSTYDPSVGSDAAHYTFLELADSSGGNLQSATTYYSKFVDVLGDVKRRQAVASGGADAIGTYVNSFVNAPGTFVATDNFGSLKSPPGGACTTNSDCLACDQCNNSVCTSISPAMGDTCTTDADCDGITSCVGGADASLGAKCMCTAAVPAGATVHSTGGTAGVYVAPAAGANGSICGGSSGVACDSGITCTDSVNGGICSGTVFQAAAYSKCTDNLGCSSNICTGGLCSPSATEAGTRATGQICSASADCASLFCIDSLCAAPPSAFATAQGAGATTLKADGAACTASSECAVFICSSGTCGTSGDSGGTVDSQDKLPDGSFCSDSIKCASGFCNFAVGGGTCGQP